MEVLRKIKLPDTFYGTDLYVTNDKLIVLSTGYSQADYSWYWVNRNTKTYAMIFDKTNINSLKLSKLYIVDGNYQKSRMIGDKLYMISTNAVTFPYYVWGGKEPMPEFDVNSATPREVDISRATDGS